VAAFGHRHGRSKRTSAAERTHERSHLTLKKKPASRQWNFLQQQTRFDNSGGLHQRASSTILDMKVPGPRLLAPTLPGLPDDRLSVQRPNALWSPAPLRSHLSGQEKKSNFSTVFAGQAVGIREVHDDIWLVSFMDYDLGYFDLETRVLEPLEKSVRPKSVTYVAGTMFYYVSGPELVQIGEPMDSNPRPPRSHRGPLQLRTAHRNQSYHRTCHRRVSAPLKPCNLLPLYKST